MPAMAARESMLRIQAEWVQIPALFLHGFVTLDINSISLSLVFLVPYTWDYWEGL